MPDETRALTEVEFIVLRHVAGFGPLDLRAISEPTRQAVINLAMRDEPLMGADADAVFATDAGRRALARATGEGT